MEKKSILAIQMTAEEKKLIFEAAKKDGRTASGFVRHLVLSAIKK